MGNCISAPKDLEDKHHAKGKPTTNHVVAVSRCLVELTIIPIKTYLEFAVTCVPVSRAFKALSKQSAVGQAKREAVPRSHEP